MTRRKPSKPRAIAEAKDDGFNIPALSLAANKDVTIDPATQKNEKRARRLNVIALYIEQRRLDEAQVAALDRLETDIHIAAGAQNCAEAGDRVAGGGSQERITQRMIDASQRVKCVLCRLPFNSARLLMEYLAPTSQGAVLTRYRPIAERIMGVMDDDAFAAMFVGVCDELVESFRVVDYDMADGCACAA